MNDTTGREDRHAPPPGARFFGMFRWILLIALVVLAAVSVGGYLLSMRPEAKTAAAEGQPLYHCPMHPTYTSDRPGECPICGMDLELVSTGQATDGHADSGNVPGLTSVHIAPDRLQMIGVRTAAVTRQPLASALELVGFVTPDEARLKRIQLRVSGWIQTLNVNRTGDEVAKGQPLLAIYSPELFQSEQEFLIELGAMDSTTQAGAAALGAARERLRLLGVPTEEITRLERERVASTSLTLRSPVTGTVLELGAIEGQSVSADTPLFTIADLSRVWVLADLYEIDFTKVRVGDRTSFEADALPGRPTAGRVEFVYPTVSNDTRTLKVRLAIDNRDGALRPGMYGRVHVAGRTSQAMSVPLEAVVNTGEHHYVFLAHEGGHFEPRLVQVGQQDGDRVQILNGVDEGDVVVASATFLIDSESRLKAAIEGMGGAADAAGGHQHGGTP